MQRSVSNLETREIMWRNEMIIIVVVVGSAGAKGEENAWSEEGGGEKKPPAEGEEGAGRGGERDALVERGDDAGGHDVARLQQQRESRRGREAKGAQSESGERKRNDGQNAAARRCDTAPYGRVELRRWGRRPPVLADARLDQWPQQRAVEGGGVVPLSQSSASFPTTCGGGGGGGGSTILRPHVRHVPVRPAGPMARTPHPATDPPPRSTGESEGRRASPRRRRRRARHKHRSAPTERR